MGKLEGKIAIVQDQEKESDVTQHLLSLLKVPLS